MEEESNVEEFLWGFVLRIDDEDEIFYRIPGVTFTEDMFMYQILIWAMGLLSLFVAIFGCIKFFSEIRDDCPRSWPFAIILIIVVVPLIVMWFFASAYNFAFYFLKMSHDGSIGVVLFFVGLIITLAIYKLSKIRR